MIITKEILLSQRAQAEMERDNFLARVNMAIGKLDLIDAQIAFVEQQPATEEKKAGEMQPLPN